MRNRYCFFYWKNYKSFDWTFLWFRPRAREPAPERQSLCFFSISFNGHNILNWPLKARLLWFEYLLWFFVLFFYHVLYVLLDLLACVHRFAYSPFCLSVGLSVCLSVRPSVGLTRSSCKHGKIRNHDVAVVIVNVDVWVCGRGDSGGWAVVGGS